MKISFQTNLANYKNLNRPNFGSFRPSYDNYGEKQYNFYAAYNPDQYNAELEIYGTRKQNGQWIANVNNPIKTIPMPQDGLSLNENDIIDLGYNFAYRYKLTDKNNPNNVKYLIDNGTHTGAKGNPNAASVFYPDRLVISKPQNAILIIPDMFHKIERIRYSDKDEIGIEENSLRNHANKLDGNIRGIISKIPELKEAGYTKIVGTPFTKDVVSSHKYWTQNAYQLDPSLGTEEDFKNLQEALVQNGMSWVADGAFVNEGLEGVHFKSILKWGNKSPFKNWFYLQPHSTDPITLGIFPENDKNVNFKVINFKYTLSQDPNTKEILLTKNENYYPNSPTLVQFFDKRLVSDLQAENDEVITSYAKKGIEDGADIVSHNDTIVPYSFEINPKVLLSNIAKRNRYIKSLPKEKRPDLQEVETMKKLFESENFAFDNKKRMSGYSAWDGNADLPKLNLHASLADIAEYIDYDNLDISKINSDRYIGYLHVKDYVKNAGRYWTNKTKNIQTLYVARQLGKPSDYNSKIDQLIEDGKLPKSLRDVLSKEAINNIVNDDYNYEDVPIKTKKEAILDAIDSFPLEALNFSDELIAVFSSPYISRRPFTATDTQKTRKDIFKNHYQNIPSEYRNVYAKFDNVLRTELVTFIERALDAANQDLNGELYDEKSSNPEISPFTYKAIKLLGHDIVKQALEMSIMMNLQKAPQEIFSDVQGALEDSELITPQHLGINALSPELEAKQVVNLVEKGLRIMNTNEVDAAARLQADFQLKVDKLYTNAGETSVNLASVIVERGDTGLGWRIDAAKDVSNMDALRENLIDFDDAWDNVIEVWSDFADAVRKENPNSYMTAELTDLNYFIPNNKNGKYNTEEKAELEFLEKTGITSFANYKYFFSALNELYHVSSETGRDNEGMIGNVEKFRKDKFIEAWDGTRPFLEHGPYDSILGAYNFYENHDKPRILHTNALNMPLFHGTFESEDNKNIARKVFGYNGQKLDNDDFLFLNPKAVAMADRLDKAVNKYFNIKYNLNGKAFNEDDSALYRNENGKVSNEDLNFVKNFHKAAAQLASGIYKDKNFEPAGFGVRPFNITIKQVFEQMKYNGYTIKDEQEKFKAILSQILAPSLNDAYKMYKYMITLPGMPTDFAGHKQGATGYESKNNNIYQQNRNRVNWEWTSKETPEKNIECVKEFEQKMNQLTRLKSDKALSALYDGDTIVLPVSDNNVMSLFRYNDKGSKVITIYSTTNPDQPKHINKILLNAKEANEGLKGGLKEGMTFVNAENEKDKCLYKVIKKDNTYYIAKFWNEGHYQGGKYNEQDYARIDITSQNGDVVILKCIDDLNNKTRPFTPTFSGLQSYNIYQNNLVTEQKQKSKVLSNIS